MNDVDFKTEHCVTLHVLLLWAAVNKWVSASVTWNANTLRLIKCCYMLCGKPQRNIYSRGENKDEGVYCLKNSSCLCCTDYFSGRDPSVFVCFSLVVKNKFYFDYSLMWSSTHSHYRLPGACHLSEPHWPTWDQDKAPGGGPAPWRRAANSRRGAFASHHCWLLDRSCLCVAESKRKNKACSCILRRCVQWV